MKNTILIKKHPSVQLAHLYEHLFLFQANELLNQRGFFKWVDFTLNGATYEQGGVIAVDFRPYNKETAALLDDIVKLQLNFDGDRLTRAIMQLHAEEYYELKSASLESLRKYLMTIDQTPWKTLDEVKVVDTRATKRRSMPLHLTNTDSSSPITTKLSLELNKGFADAYPLGVATFTVLARVILLTASYNVAKATGSYTFQMYSQHSGRKLVVDLVTATRFRTQAPELVQAVEVVRQTVSVMKNLDVFNRLVSDFQNTSYSHNGAQAPDYEKLLSDTGILVGAEGWKMIDESLIKNVLLNTSVIVRRGRQSAQHAVIK